MNTTSGERIILLALIILLAQASLLFMFGQPLFCKCGQIKLWEGSVLSSGNSQQLTDWYSFTHILHGFLFYLLLWILFPRMSIGSRFLLALSTEVSWEVFENTPMVIQHYRQQALAQGYIGDSILNSISDSLAMSLGFWMASRFPVWAIIFIGIFLEIWLGYEIRDNLTLNIMNLIHGFPAIQSWQAGILIK